VSRAAIFDMDGTLVDSEPFTAASVRALLDDAGVDDPELDPTRFFGRTWRSIADELNARHPGLGCTPEALDRRFERMWLEEPPPPIPGALEALRTARAHGRTAIATSGQRASVQALFARLDVGRWIEEVVAAEDFGASKPDPECFLLAAQRLGVEPADCTVFEDSIAGLTGARAAGMRVVAITWRSADVVRATALADLAVRDYRELPDGFFAP